MFLIDNLRDAVVGFAVAGVGGGMIVKYIQGKAKAEVQKLLGFIKDVQDPDVQIILKAAARIIGRKMSGAEQAEAIREFIVKLQKVVPDIILSDSDVESLITSLIIEVRTSLNSQ